MFSSKLYPDILENITFALKDLLLKTVGPLTYIYLVSSKKDCPHPGQFD